MLTFCTAIFLLRSLEEKNVHGDDLWEIRSNVTPYVYARVDERDGHYDIIMDKPVGSPYLAPWLQVFLFCMHWHMYISTPKWLEDRHRFLGLRAWRAGRLSRLTGNKLLPRPNPLPSRLELIRLSTSFLLIL